MKLIARYKRKIITKWFCYIVIILMCFCFTGCKNNSSNKKTDSIAPVKVSPVISITPTIEVSQNTKEENNTTINKTVPDIKNVDYSDCFYGINGCAVFFNRDTKVYTMYNKELCEKRTSPCSIFKIVTTIMGLDKGILTSVDTRMGYDKTIYPTDKWNKDLSLKDAFKESCVWYFRKVIDQIGQSDVKNYLDKLNYGNCDISAWDGSGINALPELNGFWLESSLEISPIEQVNVLADIFNEKTNFSKQNIAILKNIMLTQKIRKTSIYGKTGTGQNIKTKHRDNGWFVGMLENFDEVYYFAVHLDDENKEVTGQMAKEIAIDIIKKYYTEK